MLTCRQSAQGFQGRKEEVTAMKEFVRGVGDSSAPLIIHGKTGHGATSLMARAAADTAKWLRG